MKLKKYYETPILTVFKFFIPDFFGIFVKFLSINQKM